MDCIALVSLVRATPMGTQPPTMRMLTIRYTVIMCSRLQPILCGPLVILVALAALVVLEMELGTATIRTLLGILD